VSARSGVTVLPDIPCGVVVVGDLNGLEWQRPRLERLSMHDLLPGFADERLRTSGAEIRIRHAGSGPPLLLLHGNPQTHASWHRIAPRLTDRFHVVVPDLRGYGDSSAPEPGEDYVAYAFRTYALEQIEIMGHLGHERFFAAGHDRGARVVHRLALDHPDRVPAVAVLDILPTHYAWGHTSRRWALKTWHWAFMAQPPDLPETLMSSVPARWFMERKLSKPGKGLAPFDPRAFDEYVRCFDEKTIRGSCNEYRAAAHIDLEHDDEDFRAGRRVQVPLLALWGESSHPRDVEGDVLEVWRGYAEQVEGRALDCGHYVPEEASDEVLEEFLRFFGSRAHP
jgi:haloacetate dehalogenase